MQQRSTQTILQKMLAIVREAKILGTVVTDTKVKVLHKFLLTVYRTSPGSMIRGHDNPHGNG